MRRENDFIPTGSNLEASRSALHTLHGLTEPPVHAEVRRDADLPVPLTILAVPR
jgi:hypothetical protein